MGGAEGTRVSMIGNPEGEGGGRHAPQKFRNFMSLKRHLMPFVQDSAYFRWC